jgi:hypothetical protein
MYLLKVIYDRNKLLAQLGTVSMLLSVVLLILAFILPLQFLGVNALIKPIKFCLSIAVFAYTMAYLLHYLENKKQVRRYSRVAVVAMGVELFAIISQALRGQASHFNITDLYGGILYGLMGVFIVILTTYTLFLAILFIKQEDFIIPQSVALSIKIALVFFVIFSYFGGYISANNGHTVGASDGGNGLPFLNWSTFFGDLRVAHFFGIHSLQIIPIFAYFTYKNLRQFNQVFLVWLFSLLYFSFVFFTMIQALNGKPFIAL